MPLLQCANYRTVGVQLISPACDTQGPRTEFRLSITIQGAQYYNQKSKENNVISSFNKLYITHDNLTRTQCECVDQLPCTL